MVFFVVLDKGISAYFFYKHAVTCAMWRRGWDSNPRRAINPCWFSRPVHSTTLPPLQNRVVILRGAFCSASVSFSRKSTTIADNYKFRRHTVPNNQAGLGSDKVIMTVDIESVVTVNYLRIKYLPIVLVIAACTTSPVTKSTADDLNLVMTEFKALEKGGCRERSDLV